MAESKDEVQGVADLLAKTKVEQVNVVSFKGKSFKLNSADDGKLLIFYSFINYHRLQFPTFCRELILGKNSVVLR